MKKYLLRKRPVKFRNDIAIIANPLQFVICLSCSFKTWLRYTQNLIKKA